MQGSILAGLYLCTSITLTGVMRRGVDKEKYWNIWPRDANSNLGTSWRFAGSASRRVIRGVISSRIYGIPQRLPSEAARGSDIYRMEISCNSDRSPFPNLRLATKYGSLYKIWKWKIPNHSSISETRANNSELQILGRILEISLIHCCSEG